MPIRVMTTRHSPFYSPVICLVAAGFLEEQGLPATLGLLGKGDLAYRAIKEGRADVMQSTVSANWSLIARGETGLPVHFAQVNQRDGFFLAARKPDPRFHWKKLEGTTLLADHGAQPIAMLRYAAHQQHVTWSKVRVVDAGTPEQMLAAFRSGQGDYVHLQAPGPQELERDGAGYVVAMVGHAMPPTAFSSLCASRAFVEGPSFPCFMRAIVKARDWVSRAPAEEVGAKISPFFPGVRMESLSVAVDAYQKLGNWDGGVAIPRDLYEQTLNVFEWSGAITKRYPYEDVCLAPRGF